MFFICQSIGVDFQVGENIVKSKMQTVWIDSIKHLLYCERVFYVLLKLRLKAVFAFTP